MKQVIGLFPGQGSQKVGMGKELYESNAVARELFDSADSRLGFALSRICFEGPAEELTRTAVAQPAILTMSTIAYRLYQQSQDAGALVAAAGHSLGEYSALVAAEALSFEDAVLLVHKRGRYMQEAVPPGVGKMAAVMGKEVDELEAVISSVTSGVVAVANINAPGQIVVAGQAAAVNELIEKLPGVKTIELQVSAPFHCSLMQPAADKLKADLATLNIKPAKFPVFANVSGAAVREPDEIRQALADQVCGRVRWVECMRNAAAATGCKSAVEFGAGNVLTGLLKRIDSTIERANFSGI